MASPGNPHQAIGGGGSPLDMTKFSIPGNVSSTSNPTNFGTSSSPFSPTPSPPPPSAGIYPFATPQNAVFNHHHFPTNHIIPHSSEQQSQRSASFPTPPVPPLHLTPNHGARLMALLSAPPSSTMELPYQTMDMPIPSTTDIPEFPYPLVPPMHSPPSAHPPPTQLSSNKKPKGRRLSGNHLEYDIDFMLEGEEPPQLKVTPITKYGSDPQLVVGRQIAVNKTYICYGLKLGNIRILNINTATRSLLRGHVQRVTDMALFAEDVHLLASVGTDGRVCIWKISERPDAEEKDKIKGTVIFATRIVGEKETAHPRVCWHHHKQEVLMVGFGKWVLRIDTNKVGREEVQSTENPVQCPVDKLCDGVTLVGKHDGEVTELSMCQWMVTRLVSASMDGTVKIWEDKRVEPLTVLRPHDGRPVYSATFLTSPDRPDHTVMITAGPLNRELKLWVSSGDDGGLLTSESDEWSCTQTLEVKSSASPNEDDSFFNQVVGLSRSGLVLLANARRNAIYAVHLDYGPRPSASRLDYISEFTVALPILSFIGTSDVALHGSHTVKLYCVQTQAIQQYALDLGLCLPPGSPPPPPDTDTPPPKNPEKSVSPASSDDAFKPPTHLVTPSEILMTSSPSADDSPAVAEEFAPPSTGDALTLLLAAQQDLPGLLAAAVSEEGRRTEAAVGKHLESCVRANADATWARLQEELARHERMVRERTQNVANALANFVNRDFPAALDKAVRNVGPSVSKSVVSGLEKTVADSVQRSVGQLEKSVGARLDAAVARQLQSQFQTTAKLALQDAVRSGFEASVVPAFEVSCKTMFDQVDAAFHKGMSEHASASQLQLESAHTPLAVTLRDVISSASAMTQTLSVELAEGHRKLLALASSGASTGSSSVVDGSVVTTVREVETAPVMELPRLLLERKYEEAFTAALHRSDVAVVSWLCYQVDLPGILSAVPLPLSQGVLLSLVQQLACDVGNDTARKVAWMTDVVVAINPEDPTIALHVQQIFGQVLRILAHYGSLPTTPSHDVWSLRVIIKMIKSMLLSFK